MSQENEKQTIWISQETENWTIWKIREVFGKVTGKEAENNASRAFATQAKNLR